MCLYNISSSTDDQNVIYNSKIANNTKQNMQRKIATYALHSTYISASEIIFMTRFSSMCLVVSSQNKAKHHNSKKLKTEGLGLQFQLALLTNYRQSLQF